MKHLWLLVTVVFTLLIFYHSSLDMSTSGKISSFVAGFFAWIESLLPIELGLELPNEHEIRKLAHFMEFGLLGWLLCQTFGAYRVSNRTANGYILFIGLLVAVTDEYIQLGSAGRNGHVLDVLLDFSGVFTMWLAYRMWQRM